MSIGAEVGDVDTNMKTPQELSGRAEAATVDPCVEGGVRLLQHGTAWGLHLLLRSRGVDYSTENIRFSLAMGRTLPAVVRGNTVATEIAALITCSTSPSTDSTQGVISVTDDVVVASFVSGIRDIVASFDFTIDRESRKRRSASRAYGSKLLDWYYGYESGVQSLFSHMEEDQALRYMSSAYSYFNSKLQSNGHNTVGGLEQPQIADAVLFQHIMETRDIPKLVELRQPFTRLTDATEAFLEQFFTSKEATTRWQNSNKELCRNGCFQSDDSLTASFTSKDGQGADAEEASTSAAVVPWGKTTEMFPGKTQQS